APSASDTPSAVAPAVEPATPVKRNPFQRTWDYFDEHLGLSALRYPVPRHANTFWYTLGGMTFVGLIILVVTGIWLAQFYNPDPSAARTSVAYIQNQAPFGDIIRGIHVWTAYIVVVLAVLHLIRVVVTAAYKHPREFNWLVGIGLLGLLMFGGVFTGTVLRWDQEAYEALEHNMATAQLFGAAGGFFSRGFTSSVAILPRLYAAHVSIVPLILAGFLIAHIFLIKHHAIAPTAAQADAGEAPNGRLPKVKMTGSYSTHIRLMVGYGMAVVALAGLLGVLFPPAIGAAPDPAMEVTKPPFLFYVFYAFENFVGIPGILYSSVGLFGLLAVLPFIDRTPLRRLRRRPVALVLGSLLLVAVIALSVYVAVTGTGKHLGM
ncbi:MAG TPA: cytochrome b N-terminal domain-containing protein, partial [Ktedonobacterales bacterium]|nr:cytochrome b N-terminal domain-containing protein [Ktedonobacterales bacterium]